MNKNTKLADSRNSAKNRAVDVLVVVFCLAGMAGCLWLFRQDLYQTLSRLNVKPVGTVVLKRRIVQRRFENRLLWDRLQRTALVYSGDFIRTEEASGAAITLTGDDTVTELGENTIIRIGVAKETGKSLIELFGGTVSLSAGSEGPVLVSGKNVLALAAGSTVSASGDAGFAFRVDEGSAVFTDSKGTVNTVRAGEGFAAEGFTAGNGPAVNLNSAPRLIVPADKETFSRDAPEISFRWADADRGAGSSADLYLFELADNPAMENPAVNMRVSGKRIAVPAPENGRWYWRVTPLRTENAASVTASFSIGETVPVVQSAAQPSNSDTAGQVTAQSAAGRSAGTRPAVAENAADVRPGIQPDVQPVAQPVIVERPVAVEQPVIPRLLPPPGTRQPENGYVLGPAQLRASRNITFSWNPVSGAAGYVFSLYRETGGVRQLVDTAEIQAAGYTFNKFRLLERGGFVWTVQALRKADGGTIEPGEAAESRFTVDVPDLKRYELPETGNLYGG